MSNEHRNAVEHVDLSEEQYPGLHITAPGQLPSEAPGMIVDYPRRGLIYPDNTSWIVRKVA